MANNYLSPTELFAFMDQRVAKRLSGDLNSPSGNNANLQILCDHVAAKVDTFLTGRVALPITDTTAIDFLRGLCADMVQARLYMRRTDAPKAVIAAGRMADEWLENFMAGKVSLPNTSNPAPALLYSTARNGGSRFSHVFGFEPTDSETDGR